MGLLFILLGCFLGCKHLDVNHIKKLLILFKYLIRSSKVVFWNGVYALTSFQANWGITKVWYPYFSSLQGCHGLFVMLMNKSIQDNFWKFLEKYLVMRSDIIAINFKNFLFTCFMRVYFYSQISTKEMNIIPETRFMKRKNRLKYIIFI